MKNEDSDLDAMLEKMKREAEAIQQHIPDDAPSFTAMVEDRGGWDALPCCLFAKLNVQYFPDCLVVVSRLDSGDKALMRSIMSLMMLAAAHGATVKFQCDTDSKTFEALRRCVCLIFKRSDKPEYGETYKECSELLQNCKDKGHEQLLHELSKVTRLEGRSPILHCIPDKNPI